MFCMFVTRFIGISVGHLLHRTKYMLNALTKYSARGDYTAVEKCKRNEAGCWQVEYKICQHLLQNV